jgi:outer membrane protein OmpA-like peptidoglycan-associated protein
MHYRSLRLILILSLCIIESNAQSTYDTIKVYFPLNITSLNPAAIGTLDSVAQIAHDRNLLIYGYADYLGNEITNMALANKRAATVKQYLLSKNIKAQQILVCAGIGEIQQGTHIDKTQGVPEDRRVAIFIKKKGHSIPSLKISVTTDTILQKKQSTSSKTQHSSTTESRFELLSELKPNEVMRIDALQFQATRHFITKESEPILKELLKTLQDYPELVIRIEGHVCCMKGDGDALDTDTNDMKLSENRAKFIYHYLIENGIDKNRLSFIGYGKRKPIIAIEHSEEDAQKNRRVELRVIRN